MRHIKNSIVLFIPFLFTGCVTSLRNLVTHDKIVKDDRITGSWVYEDMKIRVDPLLKSEIYRAFHQESKGEKTAFSGESESDSIIMVNSYVISFIKNDIRHDMWGSLIKLNGDLYIDITPLFASSLDYDYIYQGVRETHTIAKVLFNGNGLQLNFISPDFITKQLENQRMAIKHEKIEMTDEFIITASSNDLQQFVLKYGKDKRFYDKENVITLNKTN